jgi:HEAT repeat protein
MTRPNPSPLKLITTAVAGNATVETALIALSRAVKTQSFYPPEHPRRAEELTTAFLRLQPLVARQGLTLVWSRDGCTVADRSECRCTSPAAQSLARDFLSRKIQRLTLLPELTAQDLRSLLLALTLDPQQLAAAGGMETYLKTLGLHTILINEINLHVSQRGQQRPPPTTEPAAPADLADDFSLRLTGAPLFEPVHSTLPLNELLALLAEETNFHRFAELVRAVSARSEELKKDGEYAHIFPVLTVMLTAAERTDRSAAHQRLAHRALEQLVDGSTTALILQQLEKRIAGQEEVILRLCGHLGGLLAQPLIQRLCSAEALGARKVLAQALMRAGTAAVPALTAMLQDERWYVVRNMVTILGEIADSNSLPELEQLLWHPEPRVRKELIRTLTKLGGPVAEQLLIGLMADSQPEIIRQAIRSLGILRSRAAVPKLLDLLDHPDRFLATLAIKKEAAITLGRIGDRQATGQLLQMLIRRHWLARQRWLELKIAISAALGQMADDSALPVLARLAARRDGLGLACSDAIDNLERLTK